MKDDYLSEVYEKEKNIEYDFPMDHLGVGDRYIYNQLIRKCLRELQDIYSDRRLFLGTFLPFISTSLNEEMKKYGFIGNINYHA